MRKFWILWTMVFLVVASLSYGAWREQLEVGELGLRELTVSGSATLEVLVVEGSVSLPAASTEWGDIDNQGVVTQQNLATDSVSGDKIISGTISNSDLAANAVTGDKIAAGTVSNADLAADAVTGDKITDGSISNPCLTDKSLSPNKLTGTSAYMIIFDAGGTGQARNIYGDIHVDNDGDTTIQPDLSLTNVLLNGNVTFSYTAAAADATNLGFLTYSAPWQDVSVNTNFPGAVITNFLAAPGAALIGARWTIVNNDTNIIVIGTSNILNNATLTSLNKRYERVDLLGFNALQWIILKGDVDASTLIPGTAVSAVDLGGGTNLTFSGMNSAAKARALSGVVVAEALTTSNAVMTFTLYNLQAEAYLANGVFDFWIATNQYGPPDTVGVVSVVIDDGITLNNRVQGSGRIWTIGVTNNVGTAQATLKYDASYTGYVVSVVGGKSGVEETAYIKP